MGNPEQREMSTLTAVLLTILGLIVFVAYIFVIFWVTMVLFGSLIGQVDNRLGRYVLVAVLGMFAVQPVLTFVLYMGFGLIGISGYSAFKTFAKNIEKPRHE